MTYIVAADTGGTFTDLAAFDRSSGRIVYSKSLTTYEDLVVGVMDCVRKSAIDLSEVELIKFGTTLIINTFLQRTGARVALVTTEGFRDTLEIRRGNRTMPFDLTYARDPVLVERDLRFELPERIGADGTVIQPLEKADVDRLIERLLDERIEAVAVSFHNAYVDNRHEQEVASALRARCPDMYVTAGTELSREWYEYERASTAVANAYVGPVLKDYIGRLESALKAGGFRRTFYLMASNGGVFSVERAQRQPVMLVESGPVGGCIGAGVYANAMGRSKVIAFDMGGTTAKCAVLEDGRFEVKSPYYVGGADYGFPIRGGVLDIVEVGTGGGSIAWLDEQGRLSVGPRSAGSNPGPACYARGGTEPTVTDANLVLGRIGQHSFLGGEMALDLGAAQRSIRSIAIPMGIADTAAGVDEMANGVLTLATLSMASAIKRITIERGLDPREFSLVCFGGGGPLHGATLAKDLSIGEVIVPPEPGVFSALGMLLSDARVDDTRTFLRELSPAGVQAMLDEFGEMETQAGAALRAELGETQIVFERQAEARFHGQHHTIRIGVGKTASVASLRESFQATYQRRYGFVEIDSPLEFVGLVLTAVVPMQRPLPENISARREGSPVASMRPVYFAEAPGRVSTPVYQRGSLPIGFSSEGPALIEEYGSTTVVCPGSRFEIGRLGELRIRFD